MGRTSGKTKDFWSALSEYIQNDMVLFISLESGFELEI